MSDQPCDFHLVLQDEPALLDRRVLVVDDAPQLKFLAATTLRDAGADVHFASDLNEALFRASAMAESTVPFDLVMVSLADDGFEVCRRLRQQGYRGPLLAVGDPDQRSCAEDAGADALLTEPVFAHELCAAAEQLTTRPPAIPGAPLADRDPVVSDLAVFPQTHAMLERFVDELPRQLSAMHAAACEHDLRQLTELVEELKRSAGSHGYVRISREAAETQRHLEATNDVSDALDELTDLCRRAVVDVAPDATLPPSA